MIVTILNLLGPKIENWRGKLKDDFLSPIKAEGINFDSGKIMVTFKVNGFKGKGIYQSSATSLHQGRIIITKNFRFIGIVGGYKLMDIPKNHPLYEKIIIEDNQPDRYIIELDLEKLNTPFEGFLKMEYHINPDKVNEWL